MYLSVFLKNVRMQLMYRGEFLLRIVGNLLYVYIQIAIWHALLSSGTGMASPVSAREMVTYIIISYLLRQASWTHFPRTFAVKVNRGDIAIDLIRPVNMKNYLLAEQLSENICAIVFSCLPVAAFSALAWGIAPPPSLAHGLLFALAAANAVALRFYLDYIAGMCVFWTRNEVYTRQILGGLTSIFSGTMIPLWFYPDWLADICRVLPFRMMAFEPVQIFMGRVDARGAVRIVLLQLLWLLAVYGVERFVWSRIKSNIFVQGG